MRSVAGRAFTELILEVFRLNGRLLAAGDALTRPAGQTGARWQVLGSVDGGPRTVADIGRNMGLTRQSVQRTTDLLEAAGLVSYAPNPAHQRAKLAGLTSKGRATLDAITKRQIEWANRIASQLVGDDLQDAIHTLQQVGAALDAPTMSQGNSRRGPSKSAPRRRPGATKRRTPS
jgi:DNA-binding MarR family transcriptional regulator